MDLLQRANSRRLSIERPLLLVPFAGFLQLLTSSPPETTAAKPKIALQL